MLIDHYARLLDLPFNEDRYDTIVHEAKTKLGGTFLFINDSLCYVNDLIIDRLSINRFNSEESTTIYDSDVHSLEVFLPETGVYTFNGLSFFLYKRTKKQWKKSFNWNYYASDVPLDKAVTFSLVGKTPVYINTEKDGSIYYIDHRIGFVKNGVYKCTDPIFSFEFDNHVKELRNGN